MKKITIDFETRSRCDIRSAGAWRYSSDDTTEVLCMAYQIDDGPAKMWIPQKTALNIVFNTRAAHKGLIGIFNPLKGTEYRISKSRWEKHKEQDIDWKTCKNLEVITKNATRRGRTWDGAVILPVWASYPITRTVPSEVLDIIKEDGDYIIEAHNAFFEKSIWTNILVPQFNFPVVPERKWRCSAAKCAAVSLPRALGNAGEAINATIQKDDQGKIVMLQMAKPNNKDEFYNDWTRWCKLLDYCIDDVRSEHELSSVVPDLPEIEQEVWFMDQEINQRGLPIDIRLCQAACKIAEDYTRVLEMEMGELTNGTLTNTRQVANLVKWLSEEQGVQVENVQKATVQNLLDKGNLPERARRVLEIRQALGQSSIAKYGAILKIVDFRDAIARDNLVYHGASTGRWAGKGLQPHNLPRGSVKPTPEMFEDILTGDWKVLEAKYDSPIECLVSCIRGTIKAPDGYKLMCADFAAIEARTVLWMAEEESALEVFRTGGDIYKVMASDIYKKEIDDIDDGERFLGKQSILGAGYGMGWKKFIDTCASYGVAITNNMAQAAIKGYRNKYKKVVKLWAGVENAAMKAVVTKQPHTYGKITFFLEGGFLMCRLPSGRCLAYKDPKIEPCMTAWGEEKMSLTFMGVNSVTRKWERQSTYGGKLVENIVQGTARDCMVYSMQVVESYGYPIILTVHDEVISLVPENFGNVRAFEILLGKTPEWADGLPVAAEGWSGERYRK